MDATHGLQIEALSPGDRLVVQTANGDYDITVLAPEARQVIVQGQPAFPEPVNACLDGCSLEGAFQRLGSVAVGYALEFRTTSGIVVTKPVKSIGFVPHA